MTTICYYLQIIDGMQIARRRLHQPRNVESARLTLAFPDKFGVRDVMCVVMLAHHGGDATERTAAQHQAPVVRVRGDLDHHTRRRHV